jgi:ABC-type uncharacterized transport system substrate-binding protein
MRAFSAALAARRPQDRVSFQPLNELPSAEHLPTSTLLVLFGEQALRWRLGSRGGPPTLVLRINRVRAEQLLGDQPAPRLSLLWSDPPPARQLRLAQLILPQAKRIGVLYSEHSAFLVEELRRAAEPLGLQIVPKEWQSPRDSRPLRQLLANSDLLLGVDDPDLYNAQTAKNLLLTSYAQQRALLGPSAAFVKAGSLASSYSDQNDWLDTLDELLEQSPEHWPPSLYSNRFKVLGNRQVARALGIELASDAELARQLAEGEITP